ncbi:MAG: hypothetical protein NWE82_00190, partial [Candidatus Bathyarchaeota archaeon]|nr:hypothetical protein [Candidatus Bathyarchaeota archaeon]
LLKESTIREKLAEEFKLEEKNLFQLQRIKYLMQSKDKAKKQSLEKLIEEGGKLLELCENIQLQAGLRTKPTTLKREVLLAKVSTGYEDLDRLLLGGIPEGYAVILAGPSCDERDLLIEKFLRSGASRGQMALHVTIDARVSKSLAEEFPSNICLLICNPEADAIIGSAPNVFKLKGIENLTEIEIALTSVLQKMNGMATNTTPRLACIEIVSDVLLQHQAVTARRWLSALIPRLESRGFTTLATMNPHMHPPQAVQAMLDLFQGEIHIYKKKTEKGLKQFLRIEKMFNQEYEQEELTLKKERMQKP